MTGVNQCSGKFTASNFGARKGQVGRCKRGRQTSSFVGAEGKQHERLRGKGAAQDASVEMERPVESLRHFGDAPTKPSQSDVCRLVFLKVGDDGEDLAAMGVVPSGDHNGAMVRCHELPRRKDEQGGNDQCIGSEGQVSDKGKSPIRRNFLGLIGVKGYIEDAFHRPCQGFKSSPNSTMSILPA
jgi:hypothetical protein